MADITINGPPQFPEGTSVAAYPLSNWNGAGYAGAAPVGSEDATATVTSGVAAFTGLTADTGYVAYAEVGGEHRYKKFSTLSEYDRNTGGGGGGHTIADEATPLTARATLNFTGAGVTVTDDSAGEKTDVSISGAGVSDSSATVKGVTKLSAAPAVASDPIAVGTNDTRVTADQAAATASIRTLGTGAAQAAQGSALATHTADTDVHVPAGTDGQLLGYVGTTPTALAVDAAVTAADIPLAAATGFTATNVQAGVEEARSDALANDVVVVYAHAAGALTVAAGTSRLPIMEDGTIIDVRAMVDTAPTGAALIVDVNKNGTTIFTTQANRPEVAISGNASAAETPDVTAVTAGDYLTVDIDQIGSTVAGSDLVVAVRIRPS